MLHTSLNLPCDIRRHTSVLSCINGVIKRDSTWWWWWWWWWWYYSVWRYACLTEGNCWSESHGMKMLLP